VTWYAKSLQDELRPHGVTFEPVQFHAGVGRSTVMKYQNAASFRTALEQRFETMVQILACRMHACVGMAPIVSGGVLCVLGGGALALAPPP
jgi:hypothetical protein